MKLETILNAYAKADRLSRAQITYSDLRKRRWRQRNAFRDRIIRMDERNNMRIVGMAVTIELLQAELENYHEMEY